MRICLVALNAYPAIDPEVAGTFGGIETRAWQFARGLASSPDTDVSLVVRHGKPLRRESYGGVRLILLRDRLYAVRDSLLSRIRRTRGFPGIRLHQPRWSDAIFLPLLALRKALIRQPSPTAPSRFYREIPADLFLTFGVQSNSATVIASAHAAGRPAALFLGSDSDLDERYAQQGEFVSVYRDRADVCRWVIQNADVVYCQTEQQQALLQTRFGRDGIVIRNPIDIAEWDRLMGNPPPIPGLEEMPPYALWIGRADPEHKRPQLLVELAKKCPEIPFLMIMNPRDDLTEAAVRREAPGNVRIVSKVPFSGMPAVFRGGAVLVNTSSLEGFPNTFLQAAISQVPIASLVVEEEFLERSGAGICAHGDLDRLAEVVRAAVANRHLRQESTARAYVAENYSLTAQTNLLLSSLNALRRNPA